MFFILILVLAVLQKGLLLNFLAIGDVVLECSEASGLGKFRFLTLFALYSVLFLN
jgi:hypothetical protein